MTGKITSDFVYKANLFRPDKGTKVDQKWKLAWGVTGPKFMRTEEEKTERHHKPAMGLKISPKMHKAVQKAARLKKQVAGEVVEKPKALRSESKAPMQSFLRPSNIVGGGFGRTGTGMVPRFVRSYWDRQESRKRGPAPA